MKKSFRLLTLALVAVMLCVTLVSCGAPNADPDKTLESLNDNGITWAGKDKIIIPLALTGLGVDDVDTVVSGTGEIDGEFAHITIIYFEEKEDAKEAWEKVQEYANDKRDDEASDWVCKKSGKMIYFGTKSAIKAAK